ncbi:MAG: hypothetical protein WCO84_05815, partial [bacterium]
MKIEKVNKSSKIYLIAFFLLPILIFGAFSSYADFNKEINYQGKLKSVSTGSPVSNDNYNVEFNLYTTVSGGTPVWTEVRTASNKIPLKDGLFSVLLGGVSSLNNVDFNQDLYLGVKIGGTGSSPTWDTEMSPRKKFGAVPASFVSRKVSGTEQSSVGTTTPVSNTSLTVEPVSTNSIALAIRGFAGQVADLFRVISSTGSQILTFTGLGNLGIGSSTPSERLSVSGNAYVDGSIKTSSIIATSTSFLNYASTTALTVSGDSYLGSTTFSGNIMPEMTGASGNISTRTIGDTNNRFSDLWANEVHIGASSLYVNGKQVISDVSNVMNFTTDVDQSMLVKTQGTGNLNLQTDTGTLWLQSNQAIQANAKGGLTFTVPSDVPSQNMNFTNSSASGLLSFNAVGSDGRVQFNASDRIGFTAPDVRVTGMLTVTGSTVLNGQTYTWPATQGIVGGFLTDNGYGGLSWTSAGQIFSTTSSLYFLSQNQGLAFSTTSATNFLGQPSGQGLAFSTSSANHNFAVNLSAT